MAPRGDAARASRGRRTSLQKLLQVAHNVLEASSSGADPVVPSLDISVAERAADAINEELLAKQPNPEISALWEQPGQDLAALVALLALALRRSSPFAPGGFAKIRQTLSMLLFNHSQHSEPSPHFVVSEDLLAAALLRASTLECYSRLLAEAAEQLRPAAALVPCATMGSKQGFTAYRAHPAAAAAAEMCDRSPRLRQQQHHPAPRGPQPGLPCLEKLLREIFCALSITGLLKPSHSTDAHAAASTSRNSTAGSTSITGSGSSASAPHHLLDDRPMHDVRSRLQSSWVLEHWARVLLLGTAPALASGDSKQQQTAQALQASLMHGVCKMLCAGGLDWAGFLARPCGGTLAASYMAHLCAALDGGHAFGLPRPQVFVLPASRRTDKQHLDVVSNMASSYDTVLVGRGAGVSLHTAVYIVIAWCEQLEEAALAVPGPGVVGPGAAGHGGAQRAWAGVEQAGSGEGRTVEEAEVASGTPGPSGNDAGASGDRVAPAAPFALASCGPCLLPPHDRAATVHVCLRLAKGVLASWGQPLAGVRLELPGHAGSAEHPLLPKGNGLALLYQALACARLALLPDVWGRARVRGRVRAQLRAWWETYMAAAQHPEALVVGKTSIRAYPMWASHGGSTQPFADAAAALEAGLLPCMTDLLNSMGAGRSAVVGNGSAVWCPPELFPGVSFCWAGALLHGPPGQVGELLSALVLRLRWAADELATAVASDWEAGGGRGSRLGRAPWLAEALLEVVHFMRDRTVNLFRCLMAEDGPELCPGGAAGSSGSGAGPLGPAAAARTSGLLGGGPYTMHGVQGTYALVEMLPALSRGVEACAGLQGCAWGLGHGATAARAALAGVLRYGVCCAADVLECVSLLLAKDGMDGLTAARERRGSSSEAGGAGGGDGGGGGADAGGGGCAGSLGGAAATAAAAGAASPSPSAAAEGDGSGRPYSPWRQLLLREVRLMQLLGAAVQLACGTQEREAIGGGDALSTDMGTGTGSSLSPKQRTLCEALARLMPVAAAAFPAQLRAAAGVGGTAAGEEAAAAAGTGHLAGRASSSNTWVPPAAPCIVLPDALAALRVGSGASGLSYDPVGVVTRVAEGWDPTLEESQSMACSRWQLGGAGTGAWVSRLQLLVSPEEARAVFLAAAAADAGRE